MVMLQAFSPDNLAALRGIRALLLLLKRREGKQEEISDALLLIDNRLRQQ